ncbi:MAG: hypothetical protein IT372_34065 [Polyangiaceae bacterium]|nr:hypothetical protein [Polyangiaceae bacterium]
MHHRIVVGFTLFGSALTVGLVTPGCGWILGLDEFVDAPPDTGGTGGTGGEGGGCEPSTPVACYEGPDGTEGVGQCVAGSQACGPDGIPAGTCEGQVLPAAETCANPADEDCDGQDCVIWAKMFGDVSDQGIGGVAVDGAGNVYVTGSFHGTVAFDPDAPISTNGSAIYVTKFDPTGRALWSKSFEGSGNISVSGIVLDAQEYIALSGTFTNTASFDGSTLQASAQPSIFLARLTSNGQVLWSTSFGPEDSADVTRPAIDSSGNIVLFGESQCDTCQPHTSRLWLRTFFQDGSPGLIKNFPYTETLGGHIAGAVTVDPFDNILITGAFNQTENFGPGPISTSGGYDVFVAKFNPAGSFVWNATYGDAADQFGLDVVSDSLGSVILLGTYAGTISFDAGSQITAADMSDIFVAKFGSGKTYIWSQSFGTTGDQTARRAAVDDDNNIVFTGRTTGQVDYGGGPLMGGGAVDIPVVKLDRDGHHLWSRVYGASVDQTGAVIAEDSAGNTILGGAVKGSIDIGAEVLSSSGERDVLLARLAR